MTPFRQGLGGRNGPLLMLLMVAAGLLTPSHEADVGFDRSQDSFLVLGIMRILLSPAPFMGICALHCLGCFGFGSNIACESSHGHVVEFSEFTYLSSCRLSLPVFASRALSIVDLSSQAVALK